jgi:hypothetical protein
VSATTGAVATPGPRHRWVPGARPDVPFAFLGALLIWGTAAIHLRLYAIGYNSIPTIGWLFLLQGVAGSALGVLILVFRHLLAYLGGAGYMASSIGGFLTSIWVGLFGFRDSFAAPYAGLAIAAEISGFAALLVAAGLWLWRHQGHLGLLR